MNDIALIQLENIDINRFQQQGVRDEARVLEIASSIKQNKDNGTKGLLQVPTARKLENGRYELAFGHHRFYAFELNAQDDPFFDFMPLIVRELSDIEMFEMMAIENFHRRDIGAIEEANTLHSYMTNFNKTSAEAAKRFEKSEEYVRGAIRLLNLPESAQTMLSAGTLNKSAARDLLVAERLGGAALVQEIVDEINDSASNGDDTPAEVIKQTLRMTDKTQFIDMQSAIFAEKKFPVKYLAKLTAKDVHDLIDFDMTGQDMLIDDVIKDLLILISSGMEIADEAFPMVTPESLERLRVLANPPQCEKCPLHATMNGTHFCGMPECKARKVVAWREKAQVEYAKRIGIPMYQKSDGSMFALSVNEDADRKLFKAGSADLRLLPAQYVYNNFEGIGMNFRVVLVGELAQKRLKKLEAESKRQQAERQQQSQKGVSEAETRQIKIDMLVRFQWEVVSLAFECLMDGITSFPFLLFSVDNEWNGAQFPDNVDADQLLKVASTTKKADGLKTLRRMAMFHMAGQAHNRKGTWRNILASTTSIMDYANDWKQIAKEWEVTLPKDFTKQAEQYQAILDKALAGDDDEGEEESEIKELVLHLINTSVEDMQSSLGCNQYSKAVLQAAFDAATEREEKTKAKILQRYLKKAQ